MSERLAKYVEDMSREKPARKKPVRHEDKFHLAVAKYLRAVIGREGLCWKIRSGHLVLWYSVETRAKRSVISGRSNKGRGCIAGCPDIDIYYNGRAFKIELKSPTGVVSREQSELRDALAAVGCEVFVCRSLDHVADVLRAWGIPTREVHP